MKDGLACSKALGVLLDSNDDDTLGDGVGPLIGAESDVALCDADGVAVRLELWLPLGVLLGNTNGDALGDGSRPLLGTELGDADSATD